MTDKQQLRAKALEIAVLLIGKIPESSDFNHRQTYEPYLAMADRIQKYIESGQPPESQQ